MTDYIEQWFYDITPITRLPIPGDLEHPDCMTEPITRWQRRKRQWRPDPTPRDCCWFHQGSWAEASRHAIALVDGVTLNCDPSTDEDDDHDPFEPVRDRLRAAGLTGWMDEAVRSLICGGEPINYGSTAEWRDRTEEPFYVGGRHRAMAMLGQGVKKTVTMRLELLDPHTRQIILE